MIQTERLLLRRMTEADAFNIFRMNSNPNVLQYIGEPTLESEEAALNILRTHILPQYTNYNVGRWAVLLRDSDTFIGWCGLRFQPDDDVYDLGYRFIEDYWGNGYATEAAFGVLEYAAEHLADAKIIGRAMTTNLASIRVLEKLGMCFECYREDHGGTVAVYRLER